MNARNSTRLGTGAGAAPTNVGHPSETLDAPRGSDFAKSNVRASKTSPSPDGSEDSPCIPAPVGEPPDVLNDLIGTTIGSYQVMELLGTGGMGSVYRAEHPRIGVQVAIKVLLPDVAGSSEVVERFVREARASGAIGSPFIPRYFDFGQLPDGRTYAIMEYFEGETVAERIACRGPMALGEVRWILDQVARALSQAHIVGIIHRDIKPENLFLALDKEGESIRVLDFGIATAAVHADPKLTQAGVFMGTPIYCAPEQIFAQPVGPPADVYALGATAFEMLTGVVPFDGDLPRIFEAKASGRIPSARAINPGLSFSVEATLSRALAFDAEARFPSMDELRASLETWEDVAPSTESMTVGPAQDEFPRRRWSRHGVALSASAAALVLAGVVTAAGLAIIQGSGDGASWEHPPSTQAPEAVPSGLNNVTEPRANEPRLGGGHTSEDTTSTSVDPTDPSAEGPAMGDGGAATLRDSEQPTTTNEGSSRSRSSSRRARNEGSRASRRERESRAPRGDDVPRSTEQRDPRTPVIVDPFVD